ncbi:MAG: OmpA family protein [Saprospiraceae bacterium]|nr:OmpA family protein [Saprospiraceae bacterium]
MTAFIIFICLVLLAIVIIQVGKVTELASKIKGEEEAQYQSNFWNSNLSLIFMVVFLGAIFVSAYYYKNSMLGYGPHIAASKHGKTIDFLFNVNLWFTGIVFVLTHIALFWFAYKYSGKRNHRATFISHDNKLEIIWTAIPAAVMTLLVVGGLDAWNDIMADIKEKDEYIEIEATGMQFAWLLRYPGADGKLGTRDFKKISSNNPFGQDWTDTKNLDDIHASEIVLPVGKKVRVRITSRDVLHSFFLPHFRVKMDAVPGMPTYFVFTPTTTTAEYRQRLSRYNEWQEPSDPKDPESKPRWQVFDYELACAELCGKGHFSMRRVVRIVSEDEYVQWLKTQKSYYTESIKGTADDPNAGGQVSAEELKLRRETFLAELEKVKTQAADAGEKVVQLGHIGFETGSAKLTTESKYQLDNLFEYLQSNADVKIELGGHTDSIGDAAVNLKLSGERAKSVADYLISKGIDASRVSSKGYGSTKPVDSADTEEARAKNRRTEIKFL